MFDFQKLEVYKKAKVFHLDCKSFIVKVKLGLKSPAERTLALAENSCANLIHHNELLMKKR
jgi:hypothetical protein